MFTRQGAVTQRKGYSVLLCAPDAYWDATPKERSEMCNGCGVKIKKWLPDFVPDTMWGLDIKDACDIHDVGYVVGKTPEDKDQADREFLHNLLRLIEMAPSGRWLLVGSLLGILRRRRALKYFEAVSFLGGPAFWHGKNLQTNQPDE